MTLTTSTTTTTDNNTHQQRQHRQRQRRFAVKKLIRNTNGKKWDVVALYNDTNNFLGPADKFESIELAEQYIKSYKQRMNDRRMGKFGRAKSSISLKVFEISADGE